MSIRTLIVDDEPLARDGVRMHLAHEADVEVVGEAADGVQAVEAIRALRPDLVFLDVQMPEVDGLQVVERIGAGRMPAVIFATAYHQHAVRAFELHAVDYLLKPVTEQRIRNAMTRARLRLATRGEEELTARLEALLEDLRALHARADEGAEPAQAPRKYAAWISVAGRTSTQLVRVEDVDWFEAEGNYVRLHVGKVTHLIRSTLRAMGDQLDPAMFIRIHRSTIVNVNRIREIQPWFGGDYIALLNDGRQLRVSRSHREQLLRPVF
ncbi:LytR/AlgR family response regulator transcription factor [Longimicrobium sp.]|uniref:LytR/AlgR family response regulator transcription factor n=1 Tax=Longimicrobium sp. TaxID=2029185 RepID=UPI003B3A97C3